MIAGKKPLIVILGPTAVGKTRLSLAVAQLWKMEIVSADALQVYKHMDIGTAKPSPLDRSRIPHHMIDLVSPDEHYNAGRYERDAGASINQIHQAGKIPLLVGGCGLYLRAVLHGLFHGPGADPELRKRLQQEAEIQGVHYLHEQLEQVDPESARRLHPNDYPRIIRAIEVYIQSGIPLSALQRGYASQQLRYHAKIIGLTRDRNDLYARIEKRVDDMLKEGLLEEVKRLLEWGYSEDSTALQGLGYKQLIAAIHGRCSLEEAVRLLKRDTRHYAKRQFTWFRQVENVQWINLSIYSSEEQALSQIKAILADNF